MDDDYFDHLGRNNRECPDSTLSLRIFRRVRSMVNHQRLACTHHGDFSRRSPCVVLRARQRMDECSSRSSHFLNRPATSFASDSVPRKYKTRPPTNRIFAMRVFPQTLRAGGLTCEEAETVPLPRLPRALQQLHHTPELRVTKVFEVW